MKYLFILALLAASDVSARPERFYLGTYTDKTPSQGIYTGTLDSQTGQLGELQLAAAISNPSFLALSQDGRFLYSVTATNGGSVAAFQRGKDGKLALLNTLPSGKGGCHVAVASTGKNVLVANYGGATVTGFLTKRNGSLDQKTASVVFTGSGPNPARQEKPHPHSAYFDHGNRHVYVCDLGTDNVNLFDLDARYGTLRPSLSPSVKVPGGSGPRHLAFSPAEHFAYVNGEMGLNVTVFARNLRNGVLVAKQTVSVLPPGADTNGLTSAEIICHPNGKWLYVSNRDVADKGRDSLSVFAIDADGTLTLRQNFLVPVKVPRGFNLDPSGQWLLVGGQADNRIAVLKIDAATGELSATGQTAAVGAPVCVVFAR